MNDKQKVLTTLREEFNEWEQVIAGMSEAQLVASTLPSKESIKAVLAHLWVWQQISIARLTAVSLNTEPDFPEWVVRFNADAEEHDTTAINAWIEETYRNDSWATVYHNWRTGFLRFLELGEAIPESNLMDAERYPYLRGYSPADVLVSSYEHHHQDHLEPLLAWLNTGG